MVLSDHFNGVETFQCEECGSHYTKQNLAEVCEGFGETYGKCNPEITRNALEHTEREDVTF